ncbi:putative thiosulfate sulfurtransferase [Methylocella tundrae]|uniref:Putative thiosulfate sulfurtransferase n=1 Tax=Methylocella tundrae TaxID=227605 RepID=A0A8B6M4S9_METTU|nr:ankyrin repeat domain-containing protein [Methylocella tundrae]VTZ27203.1 putative thiosulfate sulfurtransferase [Methylocella tundrae]VTZ49825.1 putative thiosulfate sulfurtransferase [Methylocella tundrae]
MRERMPFRRIGVEDAQGLLTQGALVLDVRDADSFRRARIDGAHNVSTFNLSTVIETTPKNKPVLIYCYHGNASQEYARILSDFGFLDVYSLDGGYEAWRETLRASPGVPLDDAVRLWLAENGFPAGGVNAAIDNGSTPLMKASHKGRCDIVRRLIATGAELGLKNNDGNNALWLACVGAHLDVIDALVEAGVDINNRNDNGATSLMYASSTGKAPVVERLLLAGADIAVETLDGFSALDMAATVECLTLLRAAARLRDAGAATLAAGHRA